MHFSGSNLTSKSGKVVDQIHGICFLERRRNRCRKICYYDLDILSCSGDIRNQIRKLQKIDRNFACFWPLKFFRGGPQVVRPWPAIAARLRSCGKVSRRSAEGSRRYGCLKKKKRHGHKPVRNGCSGRPNEGCNSCATVVQVLQDLF